MDHDKRLLTIHVSVLGVSASSSRVDYKPFLLPI